MDAVKRIGNGSLTLRRGDITLEAVDAIVNAANSHLAGGGGVDGAIHRRGGPRIMAECRRIGGCPTGQTVATTAGELEAKQVLHTVGPIWRGGGNGEAGLLASCYRTALELARDAGFASIAFPSVSTGVYAYPVASAAVVALGVLVDHLRRHDAPSDIRVILFDDLTFAAYRRALEESIGK